MEQLVRQVRIDLRFLKRSTEALNEHAPSQLGYEMLAKLEKWLGEVEIPPQCPACMDEAALAELAGEESCGNVL